MWFQIYEAYLGGIDYSVGTFLKASFVPLGMVSWFLSIRELLAVSADTLSVEQAGDLSPNELNDILNENVDI